MIAAFVRGKSAAAPVQQRPLPPPLKPDEYYTIPSVAAPGSTAATPHVVICRLPGNHSCTCAIPHLSAVDVRRSLAHALRTSVESLKAYVLLIRDARQPDELMVWDEASTLPHTFFAPEPRGRGRRRHQQPTLELHRPPYWSLEPDAMADGLHLYLECEATLLNLRQGGYPLVGTSGGVGREKVDASVFDPDVDVLLELAAAVLLLVLGGIDPGVLTARLLARSLAMLMPSLPLLPGTHHERLLHMHGRAAAMSALSVHAARRQVLARLRRALPLLRVDPGETSEDPQGRVVDLAKCITIAGVRLAAGRARTNAFVAVGDEELGLLLCCASLLRTRQPRAASPLPRASRTPDGRLLIEAAARLPWLAIEQCALRSDHRAVDIIITASYASVAKEAFGRAGLCPPATHRTSFGGLASAKIRLHSPQAPRILMLLRAHVHRALARTRVVHVGGHGSAPTSSTRTPTPEDPRVISRV